MRRRIQFAAAALLLAGATSAQLRDAEGRTGGGRRSRSAAPVAQDAPGEANDDAPEEVTGETEEAPVPSVPAFVGTFAQGMAEVAARADDEPPNEALAVADSLLVDTRMGRVRVKLENWTRGASERAFGTLDAPLTWLGLETRTAADRAEVHYAKGLVHMRLGSVEPADKSFELARVLAGPGPTRLDATYDLGTLDLLLGEALRAQIPELGGTLLAPAGAAPGAGEEEAPDPLEIARAAFERAKAHFVERLQAEWRDADTRANLELTMRRLAELDEIERQREDQQQEQQNEQDQDQEGESGDPSENEGEQEPSDQDQEGEPQDPDEQDPEPSDPSETENEGDEGQEEGEPEERFLTEEEMKRLLDQLRDHDEEGERMRERIRRIRRVPVRRDW